MLDGMLVCTVFSSWVSCTPTDKRERKKALLLSMVVCIGQPVSDSFHSLAHSFGGWVVGCLISNKARLLVAKTLFPCVSPHYLFPLPFSFHSFALYYPLSFVSHETCRIFLAKAHETCIFLVMTNRVSENESRSWHPYRGYQYLLVVAPLSLVMLWPWQRSGWHLVVLWPIISKVSSLMEL